MRPERPRLQESIAMIKRVEVERAIAVLRDAHPVEFALLQAADREYSDFRRAYATEVLKKCAAGIGQRIGPEFGSHATRAWMRLEGLIDRDYWRNHE